MFYRTFRAFFGLVLRLFFRLEPAVDPTGALRLAGPVIFVGNHPNGLVDPGLIFILADRHVTFLAKAPLFRLPVLGWLLKGLDALPVFRRQDSPADMAKNDTTLTAAIEALVAGRAITIFPEGKSHSEPQLAALKTGCARIALAALRRGAPVRIVPVGLVYGAKNRFRSAVHVEVGAPLEVKAFLEQPGQDPHEAARRLTCAIADALGAVTLNLDHWEDLPIVESAEALYALAQQDTAGSLERQMRFARGLKLLRDEQPERFEQLKGELASYRHRLALLEVTPDDLSSPYRPRTVVLFVLRNLLWLFGLPLFLLGLALFFIPYWVPSLISVGTKADDDVESTIKVLVAMLLAPVWWALLAALAIWEGGAAWGLAALIGAPPLALFTRYFFERRSAAVHDARVFLVFWSRQRLKRRLLDEGQALAKQIAAVADELKPRVAA